MDLAVRTTASPTAIWVIAVVMTICTCILAGAVWVADSWQARASRRAARLPSLESASGPASLAAAMEAGRVPAQRSGSDTTRPAADPAGEAPTLPDMPPVTGRHAMTARRGGDAGQPERSYRAGGPADDQAGQG